MIINITLEDHDGNVIEIQNSVTNNASMGKLLYGLPLLSQEDTDFELHDEDSEPIKSRWN
ncbi:hypothetical protein [uncultured Mediterranean phage uvMED]|nr:hypothetical protein [uncultured phage MedDCM-OCT-S12-C102]BAQ84360.1 hypothetical protein [uncultured Mediterranean phage uvMED]BAQ84413.1 hypothetical protein [uncultured Mediterranean phage uvMED]BAQ84495.1 hypothetical protein [uncultured Mediterranean phage uvMED]BAQ84552.1 hypothetical protein [uncultured Mediterranean phage uvMED]